MSSSPEFWINGQAGSALSLPDRGHEFGDGLFETLLLIGGVPQFPGYHERRLHLGFERLRFAGTAPALSTLVAPALDRAAEFPLAALRLTLSRAAGARGYEPGNDPGHSCVLRLTALHTDVSVPATPASLGVSSIALASQPALAGIKHLNRLEQVLAAAERQRMGVDEVVTCDQSGHPVAVASGNLFIRVGDRLLTPTLHDCGIAGTRRALILDRWAGQAGFDVGEQRLSLDELESADEILFCNSLIGVRPVKAFRTRRWRDYPAASALQQVHLEALAP